MAIVLHDFFFLFERLHQYQAKNGVDNLMESMEIVEQN